MKNKIIAFFKQHKIEILLFAAILLIHAYFRLRNPLNVGFNYDQEMIAEKVWDLANLKKLTLIGTRIGNFSFFTSPYYIYTASIFGKIFNFHPIFNFYHAYFWSFLSLMGTYLLLKQFFSKKIIFLSLLLLAVSPYLIETDRTMWNDSPVIAVSAFSLFFLIKIINSPNVVIAKFVDLFSLKQIFYWGLALSLIMGLASHFTVVFLVIFSILVLIFFKKFDLKSALFFLFVVLATVTPIVLFDLRHDFLNFSGVIDMLTHSGKMAAYSNIKQGSGLAGFLSDLFFSPKIYWENFGRLFGFISSKFTVLVGFILSCLFLITKQPKNLKMLAISYLLLITGVFFFYHGVKPDYYYLSATPFYFLILTGILNSIKASYLKYAVSFIWVIMIVYIIYNHSLKIGLDNRYSLGAKMEVLNFIKEKSGSEPIKINFDLPYSENFGFTYLSKYIGINTQKESQTEYVISYPIDLNKRSEYDLVSGSIGINGFYK